MSEEEAIQDVDLFSGIDLESMKDDEAADIMEEIYKKLEADPELQEKHAEYAQRANEFIGLKRQISRERYTERNAAFLNRAGLAEKDLVFVSRFSPMIIAEITVEKVKALAGIDEVVFLDEFVNVEGVACQSISLQVTQGDYNRTVYGYTGTGVNVGQIDNGMPMFNSTANIAFRENTLCTDHATRSAEIIGGDNGYAPNCMIFSYQSMNSQDFQTDVENLLDYSGSNTIHLINVSMDYSSLASQGTYETISTWTDYIIEEYEVIFIAASGNKKDLDDPPDSIYDIYKVAIPAMAYNTIAVGNYNDNNTVTRSDDSLYYESIYIENNYLAEKPDIVAPGTNIDVYINGTLLSGINTGTSFAAPQVTGTLAQLMYAHMEQVHTL